MTNTVGMDDLVALHSKAVKERNEHLQTLVIESAQQLSAAEGAEAFAAEAARLIDGEVNVGEAAAVEAGEAAAAEAVAVEAGDLKSAEAAAAEATEYGFAESLAIEAAESIGAEAAAAEATGAEALESTQVMHSFLKRI
jgi:hypothetical protein